MLQSKTTIDDFKMAPGKKPFSGDIAILVSGEDGQTKLFEAAKVQPDSPPGSSYIIGEYAIKEVSSGKMLEILSSEEVLRYIRGGDFTIISAHLGKGSPMNEKELLEQLLQRYNLVAQTYKERNTVKFPKSLTREEVYMLNVVPGVKPPNIYGKGFVGWSIPSKQK